MAKYNRKRAMCGGDEGNAENPATTEGASGEVAVATTGPVEVAEPAPNVAANETVGAPAASQEPPVPNANQANSTSGGRRRRRTVRKRSSQRKRSGQRKRKASRGRKH